jgi:signal transduction histidine kinase
LVESLHLTDPDDAPALVTIIDKVKKTWSSVADVHVHTTDPMTTLLESDPQLMRALSELIPELVFNSVKHGDATDVSCDLVQDKENTVTLTCVDNGTRPAESSRVGLGTKLLDEYATHWTRKNDGTHTLTTLVLPISPFSAAAERTQ